MTVFEPLFLLLVLVSIGTFITAAVSGLRGQGERARRIVLWWMLCAAIYLTVVMVVSIVRPRRVYAIGDMQCFDDWCITVTDARRGQPYEVSLRLSSRAKRVPQGEKGTVVYLTDAAGHRYNPLPDPAAVAFDTQLQPGESVMATRRFEVPGDARDVGLIYTHEGGFPIGWLIIGEGGWFGKRPVVMLR